MRYKDIEIDGVYFAGQDGVGNYSAKAKCRVIGPGELSDAPRGSRAVGTGQRVWLVEWLTDNDRGFMGRIEAGTRTVVASTWIIRPWTAEDDEAVGLAAENTARSQALAQRLIEAFGLEAPRRHDRLALEREDEGRRTATVLVRGASGASPEYVLTFAAVELLLETLERVRLEGIED